MEKETMVELRKVAEKRDSEGMVNGLLSAMTDWNLTSQLSREDLIDIIKELDYVVGSQVSVKKYNSIIENTLNSIEEYKF